jgi:pyruvate dehydrogenase E2 component (dihydrolipoamide acetyltransferase)
MPYTLYMPKLSPTMESGNLVKWHKKEGDSIQADDLLFEVATDKATVEHNAIDSGWLAKILVKEGQDAAVNQPVAILTEKKGESIEGYKPESISGETEMSAEPVAEKAAPKEAPRSKPFFEPPPLVPSAPKPADSGKRMLASPLAKRLAKDQGLDLSSLQGSGPSGRIMSRDLAGAKKGGARGSKTLPDIAPGSYTEETLSPMRKVISQRLQESKSWIPHFYLQQTIDAEALVSFREQLKKLEHSISFNDCVVKACALALQHHPVVNSGFNANNQAIIHYQTVDVAVAVSVPGGLITPIIRFADYKDLADISTEIKELASRAKVGKLEPHEYQGGSFTVSNLGMFGTTNFQAIINPPQAAILAVGGILDAPVVKNGAVVPGKQMNLSLSVDHRVVDGVAAAEFMRSVQKLLENPISLLL